MTIKTKCLREGAKLPFRATEGSAGADLHACIEDDIIIEPNKIKMIPIGIAVEIPSGYCGFVYPRSSLGSKFGITLPNSVGVIDSDYRGELCVPLINHGDNDFIVRNGERIAQLVIMPVENPIYEFSEELSTTERGIGGFGSTGK
ncbi:MAG: dUTP diphosphatase [Ruminococcaceae bacterium]|nr:dUTP diphosphatase [Oscillospiraceae bacterium]